MSDLDGQVCSLAGRECIPCTGAIPPLNPDEQDAMLEELGNGWQLMEHHHLEKTFTFSDFAEALAYTNKVGALAEQVGHHPDILTAWGKVVITIFTHKIDGLTDSDFILAAKIDEI